MKYISNVLVMFASLMLFAGSVIADVKGDAETEASKLVRAVQEANYAAFVADGDAAFKGLTEQQFDQLAKILGPRLKAGHELVYLGALQQRGFQVSVWKITFVDGGDDALATLSLKDRKVGGFWVH